MSTTTGVLVCGTLFTVGRVGFLVLILGLFFILLIILLNGMFLHSEYPWVDRVLG